MGAVGAALGAEVRGEALRSEQRVEPLGDAFHRGVAGGEILLGQTALIIAAHTGPQEEMGRSEPTGRRPLVVQGEIGIDDKLETVVEGVGLLQPVRQPVLFGVGLSSPCI